MTSEEFIERFNEGKISYKLPSKYPENFALCKSYIDGKREIPLAHKEKVEKVLKECYTAIKPVLKKFKLSLALLIESEVTYKGVAWTKKIKVNFSNPTDKEKKEELIAYTNMIQIKIRNKDHPQNPKMFLNRTTVLAIMLHELAHLREMNHSIDFALFLREIYRYAMTLDLFSDNEEHMLPSSRLWERRMFETKGRMTRAELDEFFDNINSDDKDDSLEHEHGEEPEKEETESKKVIVKKPRKPLENKEKVPLPLENKAKVPLRSNTLKMNKAEPKKEDIQKSVIFRKDKAMTSSIIKTIANTKVKITVNLKTETNKILTEKTKVKVKKSSENSTGKEEEVIPIKKKKKSAENDTEKEEEVIAIKKKKKKTTENGAEKEEEEINIKKKKKKAKILATEEVIEGEKLFESQIINENPLSVNEEITREKTASLDEEMIKEKVLPINEGIIDNLEMVSTEGDDNKGLF